MPSEKCAFPHNIRRKVRQLGYLPAWSHKQDESTASRKQELREQRVTDFMINTNISLPDSAKESCIQPHPSEAGKT